jgi:hypothetical protein
MRQHKRLRLTNWNAWPQVYEKLAVGLELKFIAALDLLNLPERSMAT